MDSAATVAAILDGFRAWRAGFDRITARASRRFESRDWHGFEADALERLDLYGREIGRLVERLGRESDRPESLRERETWMPLREVFDRSLDGEPNPQLARTWFNSVTRRLLDTQGIDETIEFVAPGSHTLVARTDPTILRRFDVGPALDDAIRDALERFACPAPWADLDRDAARVARRIERLLDGSSVEWFELLDTVFFRMKHAYLVGRARIAGGATIPLILALLHGESGVFVDAVLIDEDEASIVFSFTRAYFHVRADRPRELVRFLRTILPHKPPAELYMSIGQDRHGKTVLYGDLRAHLRASGDRFVHAPGEPGMVMLVFMLPSYDLVFKLIRDRFAPPKHTTAREVMARYRIVAERDRVGRLVDAQSYEHLELPRERFDPALLDELQREAGRTVRVDGDRVILDQVYTERRITPLDIYLRRAPADAAAAATIDYGHAIRELAAANVFPGDFLLKNFGVTRHGRVVFYDYDELCLLTDCRFRRLPPPRTPEDELAAEPWFSVGRDDVFPEEFERFLGFPAPLRAVFDRHHADLLDPAFWSALQERHEAGEIFDVYPYPRQRRLGENRLP